MKKVPFALLFFLLAQLVSAQQKSFSFEDLERQMMEMQRQLMQEFQKNPFGSGLFISPGGDSSYTFRFDTTIIGDNFSGSFHFGPFSGDSTRSQDFSGFEWLQKQFFGNGAESDVWGRTPESERLSEEPLPEGEEGLLPEERMRRDEEQRAKGVPQQATPPAEPAKTRIKTIRI